MYKILIIIALTVIILSCKKENSTQNTNSTTTNNTIGKYGDGVTDIDSNKYITIILGSQEWMGENLKVTRYNNGFIIPNVTDTNIWGQKPSVLGAWCNYNNNDSIGEIYGKLYNGNSIWQKDKNVCPFGWHVPSENDWLKLVTYIDGLDGNEWDYINGKSTAGGKLKEVGVKHWQINVDASNLSLFTALPSGGNYGGFSGIGKNCLWWTSSHKEFDGDKKTFCLESNDASVGFGVSSNYVGLSIRCIKD